MKNFYKFILVFILSFLAVFYNFDSLNIILVVPLLAFFMFNGITSFVVSLGGLAAGSLTYYIMNNDYVNVIFLLLGLCFYFLVYHISLLFHKKLILNYVSSCIISITITYLIYSISNNVFNVYHFILAFLLGCVISLLFAFLLKKFSFYLFTYQDEYTPVLLISLTITYLSLLSQLMEKEIFRYLSLFLILLTSLIFALKSKLLNVLSFNSLIILIGLLYNLPMLYEYVYLVLPISVCLCLNKTKYNYLNSLLVLACFIIVYLLKDISNLNYYLIISISIPLLLLFVHKKDYSVNENQYYKQYVKNKNEMLFQLKNFQNMFLTLSENFKTSRQTRILTKAKEEVFDTLCKDCPEMENCHKKGKHLLLNYIRDSLNDELDDNKIRYIKQNCIKQEAYFTLLDKFTNSYLINNYQKEEEARMKEIIAADFFSFSKIMEQCSITFNNDKLILANNFYKNLHHVLQNYQYDVLFINNHSTEDKYQFDIAIKDITIKEIESTLLPLIDETLQTNMRITRIDTATLSSSYFIVSISEIENIKIEYAYKQSNEDIKANGDSVASLCENKFFFFALSDGMGNGMDANEESKFTIDTVMSMLKTNMDVKTTINIANDIIQLKNDFESYTTLDLLAIDMKKKIASFYKLGAFNAYIIRNHQVTEVNNFSLPLGIIDSVNPSASSYKIEKNDIIIMCSDGMIDDTNKSIISILEDIKMDSPTVICNTLFLHLIDIRQNSDDATLAVITIK